MVVQPRVRGFTLIELLISISVMSMVIGISTYAFSLFTRNWDGQTGSFDRAAGQLQRIQLLNGAIRDSVAWLVMGEKNQEELGFYFLGRDEGMTFVTESPIFHARGLAVARVFREREENAQVWRLVYEEAPLDGLLLRESSQVLPFQNRLVVMRGLPAVEFRYFGWRSLAARFADDDQSAEGPRWFSDYDGIQRHQQPSKIGVTLGAAEVVFELSERDDVLFSRAREPE